jgi:hypothetical protein
MNDSTFSAYNQVDRCIIYPLFFLKKKVKSVGGFTVSPLEIKKELDRLAAVVSDLESKRASIDELITPAKRERDAWEVIYSMRAKEDDMSPLVDSLTLSPLTSTISLNSEGYGARTRVMRDHILSSADVGVTPKSVQEYMTAQNLPVSPNFVYKMLSSLRTEGKIEAKGGVFKPVRYATVVR